MGKRLIIKGADFHVNSLNKEPAWVVNGFVYSQNNRLYSDPNVRVYAFYLNAGQSINYSLFIGNTTYKPNFIKVQVGTVNGHISEPTPTTAGVSIGKVTPIKTIDSGVRYPNIDRTSYTANTDVTLFIGCNSDDTVMVLL